MSESKFSELTLIPVTPRDQPAAAIVDGTVVEPQRTLPVMLSTDVLIVGGGPAGFAAAVSAARLGSKVTIVERYGYFGGLWTGGIVPIVYCSHSLQPDGRLVKCIGGIGGELLDRLAKIPGGIVNYEPDTHSPTTDPEATKYVMDEMITEAGVEVLFHSWAVDVVMEGETLRGVVFESKSGRKAILAKVVIDASGDGDIFAAAGAEYEQRAHAIGLNYRLGNTDRVDNAKLKESNVYTGGMVEPLPSVNWVNVWGPTTNGLDVRELTRMELRHRSMIWKRIQKIRATPGGEALYLLQTATQLGVRTTRILAGEKQLTFQQARAATTFPDTIGVGGAQEAEHPYWPIPYGTLVPKRINGLLAAGRNISVDKDLINDMRVIQPCLITGHAAGAAAALSVQAGCQPREVDIALLQKMLISQGAFLGE